MADAPESALLMGNRMDDALDDVVLFTFVYNRFELMRASLLSVLAFRNGIGQVHVIDDCSTDGRVARWLESLASSGEVTYHRRTSNGGPGRCRRLSAHLCPDWATYTFWIDSDIVVGPTSFTTMRRIADAWWTSDRPIGILCALATRPPRADDRVGTFAVFERWGDLGLVLIRASLLREFGDEILNSRRDEAWEFTKSLKAAGYRRVAAIEPPIPCAHLGLLDSTVPVVAGSLKRLPWGTGPYTNPLENLLDYEMFFKEYPASAVRLGDQIRDEHLMEGVREVVLRADGAVSRQRKREL